MRLKLLCSRAGIGVTQNAGDEIDVCDAEGARMIDAGQAVPCASMSLVQEAKQKGFIEKAVNKIFGEKAVKDE